MASPGGPTVRRRQLADALKRLRLEARLSPEQAIEHLGFSRAKLFKIEGRSKVGVSVNDVRAMCQLYGADEELMEHLVTLAKESKQRGWWAQYEGAGAVPDWFERYVGLESEATRARVVEDGLVDGLLQTENYARAVYQAARPSLSDEEIEQRVSFRAARQERLTGTNTLNLWAIMDQAALQRMTGGPAVMREQLRHLLEVGRLPNITIQILPFSVGALPAAPLAFRVLDFVDLPTIAYVELLSGSLYPEEEQVTPYIDAFNYLQGTALGDRDSAKLITARLKDL